MFHYLLFLSWQFNTYICSDWKFYWVLDSLLLIYGEVLIAMGGVVQQCLCFADHHRGSYCCKDDPWQRWPWWLLDLRLHPPLHTLDWARRHTTWTTIHSSNIYFLHMIRSLLVRLPCWFNNTNIITYEIIAWLYTSTRAQGYELSGQSVETSPRL